MTVCGNKLSGVCGACTLFNICRNNELANLPKSNIEWMREASLEELAGAIYEWHTKGYTKGRLELELNPITEIVEWLKQPHHEKERAI